MTRAPPDPWPFRTSAPGATPALHHGPTTTIGSPSARKRSELPGHWASMPQKWPPKLFQPPPLPPRPWQRGGCLTWGLSGRGPDRPGVLRVGGRRGRQDPEPLRSSILPARGSLQVRGPFRREGCSELAASPFPAPSRLGGLQEGVPLFHFSSVHTPQRETVFSPPTKKKKKKKVGRGKRKSARTERPTPRRLRGRAAGQPPLLRRKPRQESVTARRPHLASRRARGSSLPLPRCSESGASAPATDLSWLERPPWGYAEVAC